MRWLVTGGCGFIGLNLIERLLGASDHHAVRILDNLTVGTRKDLASVTQFDELSTADHAGSQIAWPEKGDARVQLVVGDILDEELTGKVAAGCDVIVHLAANTGVAPSVENPRLDCVTNVTGTLNMLEAARHNKVTRFVFASSGAPVGEVVPPIHEELAPHPVSPYGASKLAGEGYCSAYFRTFGVETVALRFGNVYGPRSGHKSSVVAKFIRSAQAGETLEVYGDGKQTRDFIYIEDLVRAVERAATRSDVGGEVFQIATNAETTVGELVECILPILSVHGVPDARLIHTERRLGDVARNYSDTSKAKRILGWKAQTQLPEGLEKTVKWFTR